MKKNILIYGTGGVQSYFMQYIDYEKTNVLAFIDTYSTKGKFDGLPIIREEQICKYNYDYIVIACGNVSLVKRKLIDKYKVEADNIIAFIFEEESMIQELNKYLNKKLEEELNLIKLSQLVHDEMNLPSMNATTMWFYKNDILEKDYVREQTLRLLAEEVQRKKLEGEVAELGVFKGDFSEKINKIFYNRKLYLYDTFEGFDKNDISSDQTITNINVGTNFQNTSIEYVLSRMQYPENCIVKKGYFPDTYDLDRKNIKLVFVSIDVDLYHPILAGLEKFYPRICEGGYIMVHDYRNHIYDGTRRAVIDYCDKNGISYVPIADMFGSIVITK